MVCPAAANMGTCDPKCRCTRGDCSGLAYNCAQPCPEGMAFNESTCDCSTERPPNGEARFVGTAVHSENGIIPLESDWRLYEEGDYLLVSVDAFTCAEVNEAIYDVCGAPSVSAASAWNTDTFIQRTNRNGDFSSSGQASVSFYRASTGNISLVTNFPTTGLAGNSPKTATVSVSGSWEYR